MVYASAHSRSGALPVPSTSGRYLLEHRVMLQRPQLAPGASAAVAGQRALPLAAGGAGTAAAFSGRLGSSAALLGGQWRLSAASRSLGLLAGGSGSLATRRLRLRPPHVSASDSSGGSGGGESDVGPSSSTSSGSSGSAASGSGGESPSERPPQTPQQAPKSSEWCSGRAAAAALLCRLCSSC